MTITPLSHCTLLQWRDCNYSGSLNAIQLSFPKSISTTIYKETQVLLTPFCYSIDFHHCPLFQPYRSSIISSFTNILYFFLSIPLSMYLPALSSPLHQIVLHSIRLCYHISLNLYVYIFRILSSSSSSI